MADYDKNVDIDVDSDTDAEMMDAPQREDVAARPSLRETWDNSPVLKIAALVIGGIVLAGGYLAVFGGDDGADNKAIVVATDTRGVSAVPGTENADPEYIRALEEQNKADAVQAMETGGSAIPTPIGTVSNSALTVPQAPEAAQSDPLTAWRREAENRRQAMEDTIADPQDQAPLPEVVPMVQPVRPQQQTAIRMDPEAPKALAAQMRVILAAQAPAASRVSPVTAVPSGYIQQKKDLDDARQREALARSGQGAGLTDPLSGLMPGTTAAGAPLVDEKVIVSAGSIVYGQLMNQLNSDLPGPVLVNLLSGPFAGGRAIGQLEVRQEYMVLTFNKVIKDGVVYAVQAVALDEATTLTGHRTSIDRHYLSRVLLPAAAEFIKGYASAKAETETQTTTTSGGGVVESKPKPSASEQFYAGVEEGADELSAILEEGANRPITVHLDKGVTMGLLFIDSVTTGSAQ